MPEHSGESHSKGKRRLGIVASLNMSVGILSLDDNLLYRHIVDAYGNSLFFCPEIFRGSLIRNV